MQTPCTSLPKLFAAERTHAPWCLGQHNRCQYSSISPLLPSKAAIIFDATLSNVASTVRVVVDWLLLCWTLPLTLTLLPLHEPLFWTMCWRQGLWVWMVMLLLAWLLCMLLDRLMWAVVWVGQVRVMQQPAPWTRWQSSLALPALHLEVVPLGF